MEETMLLCLCSVDMVRRVSDTTSIVSMIRTKLEASAVTVGLGLSHSAGDITVVIASHGVSRNPAN